MGNGVCDRAQKCTGTVRTYTSTGIPVLGLRLVVVKKRSEKRRRKIVCIVRSGDLLIMQMKQRNVLYRDVISVTEFL